MSRSLVLNGDNLQLADLAQAAWDEAVRLEIDEEAWQRARASREVIEAIVDEEQVVYGVTTGFGKFADVSISRSQVEELQRNLIHSHACAVGEPLPDQQVRAMIILRLNALLRGNSGVRRQVLESLAQMANQGVYPQVPRQGSLGASGDLAPLAHMVLGLMGEGTVHYRGQWRPAGEVFEELELEPLTLQAKEGLALINGTQAMTAIGGLACWHGGLLARTADIIASLTVQCLQGIPAAYAQQLQDVRPHPGQQLVAANLRRLLSGSKLTTRPGELRVQDPYTLRCIPQVHGASRDGLAYVEQRLAIEMNSATDNPLVFPGSSEDLAEQVISGGNFHGQPMALSFDFLGISLAELANIAERRIERLVNPQLNNGLPPFLTPDPGLNSGLMIIQYTAASLVSENKVLAHPASVDSITSSANQEDHVSMGTTAARHAHDIMENLSRVLAIELIAAAQAAEFRGPGGLSPVGQLVYRKLRERVPALTVDDVYHPYIEDVAAWLRRGELVQQVSEQIQLD